MAKNRFRIPVKVLSEIRARDKACVYCRKTMIYPYLAKKSGGCATIEHLNWDGPFHWPDLKAHDIALCCGSCNSSRGVKELTDWFKTQYCINKNISAKTVAMPVRSYLRLQKKHN